MATTKEIRTRITAVKSTQKITNAMKMIAMTKLRRAQEKVLSTRPYAAKLNELLEHLLSVSEKKVHQLMEKREIKKRLVVIVTADRGLCGAFNSNIIKAVNAYMAEIGNDTPMITIGKKGTDFFVKRNYNVIQNSVNVFSNLSVEVSNEIVKYILKGYLEEEYDFVEIFYNEFRNLLRHDIKQIRFLPITGTVTKDIPKVQTGYDYLYEPDVEAILNTLIPRQLNLRFWSVLLESNAAEQAARRMAMETATQNADELIRSLELSYNKARQDSITKELLEIVAGADALQKA
ncbi:MAG: ATP synthase F1 subunit gamma [Ignavibacteria bacterium]|nr:ATP synthase F1 subunit gamma [Ignavibacteria bacterium]